jgi:RNA polymerase sigma-70 factor (ECF subfamily)
VSGPSEAVQGGAVRADEDAPPPELGFDQFVVASHRRLLRQLSAMTADVEQAQDCLQEAYERAWARWRLVGGLDDPEAWVRKVAWRVAVSSHRRRATLARLLPRLVPTEARAAVRSEGPGRSGFAGPGGVEEALDVQDALRRVAADQRQALVVFYLVGMSVAEVADEAGVSVGTVKSRLHRGRNVLARLLGPGYGDLAAVDASDRNGPAERPDAAGRPESTPGAGGWVS